MCTRARADQRESACASERVSEYSLGAVHAMYMDKNFEFSLTYIRVYYRFYI